MLSDLFKSALALATNGVAAVEDIDRAWMGVLQSPVGPFGMMDKVGLDTVWKISDYWKQKLGIEGNFIIQVSKVEICPCPHF